MTNFPVLVMLPPAGDSKAEKWVAAGRLAAAQDLLTKISQIESVDRLFIIAAEEQDRDVLQAAGAEPIESLISPFHFGRTLAEFITQYRPTALAYFGGASAPLMPAKELNEAFRQALTSQHPTAIVNNYHSSDWVVLNQPEVLIKLAERLPSDNPLGWVLEHEGGRAVDSLGASAASRLDIDTPSDLLMLQNHPGVGSHVADFLHTAPVEMIESINRLRNVLSKPGVTLSLIGRTSSHVWRILEQNLQIWVRLFVEERGMVASQRLARGEVRSLMGVMLEEYGPRYFVQQLTQMSDAVVWDTRVWMAHRGPWPSVKDRFSADLGWTDQIEDRSLKELTVAIEEAGIPILTGGYGVVSGGLLALVEGLPKD